MSQDHALKTVAGLCGLWDRGRANRVRGGDGSSSLFGRRLSLHLMIQPVVAPRLLANEELQGQGIISRILMTWPDPLAGNRPYCPINIFETAEFKAYARTMHAALGRKLVIANEKTGRLDPPALRLEPKAEAAWRKFHDVLDAEAKDDGKLGLIRGPAGKAAEQALRIAGVLTLIENLDAREIGIEALRQAVTLVDYYLREALRITGVGLSDPDLVIAERVLTWLYANRIATVYPLRVYQFGPAQVRTKAAAMRAFDVLQEHGYLIPIDGGAVVDGKLRKQAWSLRGPDGRFLK